MFPYFELNEQTIVQLQGADRAKLLSNLCTQDLTSLKPGHGTEAFLTDVKGRILSHVLVLVKEHEIELVTVVGQAECIIQHLDRYTIREDVTAHDRSRHSNWIAFPSTSDAVHAFAIQPAALPVEMYEHREMPVPLDDGTRVALQFYRWPYVGPEGIVVRFDVDTTLRLLSHLHSHNFQSASKLALQAMRIKNAWPLFGIDFDEKNLPQEIGRDAQAISFTKGCYLGQETVARLDALGQVQKKLVRLRIGSQETPMVGARLTCNAIDAGWITSVATIDGHCFAFGFVKRAFLATGTELNIGEAGATVEKLDSFQ